MAEVLQRQKGEKFESLHIASGNSRLLPVVVSSAVLRSDQSPELSQARYNPYFR